MRQILLRIYKWEDYNIWHIYKCITYSKTLENETIVQLFDSM